MENHQSQETHLTELTQSVMNTLLNYGIAVRPRKENCASTDSVFTNEQGNVFNKGFLETAFNRGCSNNEDGAEESLVFTSTRELYTEPRHNSAFFKRQISVHSRSQRTNITKNTETNFSRGILTCRDSDEDSPAYPNTGEINTDSPTFSHSERQTPTSYHSGLQTSSDSSLTPALCHSRSPTTSEPRPLQSEHPTPTPCHSRLQTSSDSNLTPAPCHFRLSTTPDSRPLQSEVSLQPHVTPDFRPLQTPV